jgi:hypothetical protein
MGMTVRKVAVSVMLVGSRPECRHAVIVGALRLSRRREVEALFGGAHRHGRRDSWALTFCSGEKRASEHARTMLREPDAMSRKWPSIEELRVVVADKAARSFSLEISQARNRSRRATRAVQ